MAFAQAAAWARELAWPPTYEPAGAVLRLDRHGEALALRAHAGHVDAPGTDADHRIGEQPEVDPGDPGGGRTLNVPHDGIRFGFVVHGASFPKLVALVVLVDGFALAGLRQAAGCHGPDPGDDGGTGADSGPYWDRMLIT